MTIQIHIKNRIPLIEYMKLSRDERRAHLDLDQPCLEIGAGSKGGRALLAVLLGTTAEGLGKGNGYLCHACHNGACSNPYHHYFGTPQDNRIDFVEANPEHGKKIRDIILSRNPDHYVQMARSGGCSSAG